MMNEIPENILTSAKHAARSEAAQWPGIGDDEADCIAHAVVKAVLQVMKARDIAQDAEVLHAEHHPGTFVPSLDSCTVHERADYEQRVRDIAVRGRTP